MTHEILDLDAKYHRWGRLLDRLVKGESLPVAETRRRELRDAAEERGIPVGEESCELCNLRDQLGGLAFRFDPGTYSWVDWKATIPLAWTRKIGMGMDEVAEWVNEKWGMNVDGPRFLPILAEWRRRHAMHRRGELPQSVARDAGRVLLIERIAAHLDALGAKIAKRLAYHAGKRGAAR